MDNSTPTALCETQPMPSVRNPGDEPLPGYRLVAPIGNGGFGEVWKCEVPGGLFKAIKFISGNLDGLDVENHLAQQELSAFQRVKGIRHPFLLSMDRVEVIDGELLIVMELADKTLYDLYMERQAAGLPGIRRDELIPYLLESAEALDVMNFGHGLQHLDIKPRNLFLVGNHVKVADFGLVQSLHEFKGNPNGERKISVTPRYAAPEIIQDHLSHQSDQYSLALVYYELLTGGFPFRADTAMKQMIERVEGTPDLSALPSCDQPAVGKALAKDPGQRFPSCLDFMDALAHSVPEADTRTKPPGSDSDVDPFRRLIRRSRRLQTRHRKPNITKRVDRLPSLPSNGTNHQEPKHPDPVNQGPSLPRVLPLVIPREVMSGDLSALDQPCPTAGQLLAEILQGPGYGVREGPPHYQRYLLRFDNILECRFPVRLTPRVLDLKLSGFCQHWHATPSRRDATSAVYRFYTPVSFWKRYAGNSEGLEMRLELPSQSSSSSICSEMVAQVQAFGKRASAMPELLLHNGPGLLHSLAAFLQSKDQRARGRIDFRQSLRVLPVFLHRKVGCTILAQSKNISFGGIGLVLNEPIESEMVYLQIMDETPSAEYALLARVVRTRGAGNGLIEIGASFLVNESWSSFPTKAEIGQA
jgi:serine/threonine protein kinase